MAPAGRRTLGARAAGPADPRERAPHGGEHVGERIAVELDRHRLEASGSQYRSELVAVVAAEVTCPAVHRPELPRERRNAQYHPAAGTHMQGPLAERRSVVLDVLEHLERADEVEGRVRWEHAQVAVDDQPAAARSLERLRVGLDADVAVAPREPHAHCTLARTHLEHRLDAGEPGEQPGDDVVAEPAPDRQGRIGHPDVAGANSSGQ
jgi:hypothetical protein